MISNAMPVRPRTRSRNISPLRASRTALVATARICDTPKAIEHLAESLDGFDGRVDGSDLMAPPENASRPEMHAARRFFENPNGLFGLRFRDHEPNGRRAHVQHGRQARGLGRAGCRHGDVSVLQEGSRARLA
jgi:hypothetical protein